jgi:N-alpha-acetyltransferase 15/16, NatA auxiliary subunit
MNERRSIDATLLQIYIRLHDNPLSDEDDEKDDLLGRMTIAEPYRSVERSFSANMSASEAKKLRNKMRKQQMRDQQEKQKQLEAERRRKESQRNRSKDDAEEEKTKEEEIVAEKLERVRMNRRRSPG